MSQIVANWALFNFLLFSDGTGLMKNNRKCEVDVPFLDTIVQCMASCIERHAHAPKGHLLQKQGPWCPKNKEFFHTSRIAWSAGMAATTLDNSQAW